MLSELLMKDPGWILLIIFFGGVFAMVIYEVIRQEIFGKKDR
ncbi:MAG: hypothetical protein NTZ13_04155 [Candidatus Parcubacteria bacterium]|nr:hypothetical protein [Candidatus Parcubacteria bacterium]